MRIFLVGFFVLSDLSPALWLLNPRRGVGLPVGVNYIKSAITEIKEDVTSMGQEVNVESLCVRNII